ncbi:unnamed protein product [Lampetra planeri]
MQSRDDALLEEGPAKCSCNQQDPLARKRATPSSHGVPHHASGADCGHAVSCFAAASRADVDSRPPVHYAFPHKALYQCVVQSSPCCRALARSLAAADPVPRPRAAEINSGLASYDVSPSPQPTGNIRSAAHCIRTDSFYLAEVVC